MFPVTTTGGIEPIFQKRLYSPESASWEPSWSWLPSFRRREPLLQIIQPIRNARTPSPATLRGVEMPLSAAGAGPPEVAGGSWACREPARKKAASAAEESMRCCRKSRFIFHGKVKQASIPFKHICSGCPDFPASSGLTNSPGPELPGKIIHGHLFCRKSLRARGSNGTFSPSPTGRTKTKVKGY